MNVRDELLDHGRRTVAEAARLTGLNYNTLINWLNQGAPAGHEVTSKVAKFLKISESQVPTKIARPEYRNQRPSLARKAKLNDVPQGMFSERAEEMSRAIMWLMARVPDAELDAMAQCVIRDGGLGRAEKTLLTNAIITEDDRRRRAATLKQ